MVEVPARGRKHEEWGKLISLQMFFTFLTVSLGLTIESVVRHNGRHSFKGYLTFLELCPQYLALSLENLSGIILTGG